MIIRGLYEYCIATEVIGPRKAVLIHRILLCQLDSTIPCKTVFFLTTRKAEGQTLKYVGIFGLKFEEETSEMLHLEHGFVWC
jgi:hypothetical protein